MKFTYPEISEVFDTNIGLINSIIIENQELMQRLLIDINNQLDKNEGKSVLSENESIIPISQNLELLTEFIQFDINKKSLVNKLITAMIEVAVGDEQYGKTINLVGEIEQYLYELSFPCTGNICFEKCNIDSLIKAVSPKFDSVTNSIAGKIIDYVELVKEYDREKLFITYNLRDIITDLEAERFMEEIVKRGYHFIMIETKARQILNYEKRYIIDDTLCEIK